MSLTQLLFLGDPFRPPLIPSVLAARFRWRLGDEPFRRARLPVAFGFGYEGRRSASNKSRLIHHRIRPGVPVTGAWVRGWVPVTAACCRGLLDVVRAIRVLVGSEHDVYPTWLEVVDRSEVVVAVVEAVEEAIVVDEAVVVVEAAVVVYEVVINARTELPEGVRVVEVAGITELNRRGTLEGVVACVGDREVILDVPTPGFLIYIEVDVVKVEGDKVDVVVFPVEVAVVVFLVEVAVVVFLVEVEVEVRRHGGGSGHHQGRYRQQRRQQHYLPQGLSFRFRGGVSRIRRRPG